MFNKEEIRRSNGVEIAWYPKEKVCMVFREKSMRIYNKIPKKYIILFEKKTKSNRRKNANRIKN